MTKGAHPQGKLTGWEWALITALLLAAFALRVVRFHDAPPGVIHDEVRTWFNAQMVLNGDIRALYPYGGGREALFMFFEAASYALIGDNLLAGRLPAIGFSMVGVAATYALARRLFARAAGFVAAAGFAFSFWALMFARFAERTETMPVMALVTAYVYLRLLQSKHATIAHTVAAGLLLGATLYTYPSALIFPLLLAVWIGVLALIRPQWLCSKWAALAASFALAALIAIPLARAWANPQATARADEVNAPLEALLAGDPGPTFDNLLPVLGVFTIKGDHGLEFNIQDQPIIPTMPLAALFYAGVITALVGAVRRRDPAQPGYALILLWLFMMLIPTLVTERPVNPSRTIGLLGVVYMFPAAAVGGGMAAARGPLKIRWAAGLALLAVLALAIQFEHTARNYFVVWAGNPVVRFLYQDEYRPIAALLDSDGDVPTAIGGLTPDQVDPASMRLLANNDTRAKSAGYFDPQTSLLVPTHQGSDTVNIAIPSSITLHPVMAEQLSEWGLASYHEEEFTLYSGLLRLEIPGTLAEPVPFYAEPETPIVRLAAIQRIGEIDPGQPFTLITYWQAEHASDLPLRIFVHLTTTDGTIVTQSDVLGVPATQWQPGDFIAQAHDFTVPPDASPGLYVFNIGLYSPETNTRLMTDAPGGDHVRIEP